MEYLTEERKTAFLGVLQGCLKEAGMILSGDGAFETRGQLNQRREAAGDEWDDEEVGFVADEPKRAFPKLSFTQVSSCAGILTLPR